MAGGARNEAVADPQGEVERVVVVVVAEPRLPGAVGRQPLVPLVPEAVLEPKKRGPPWLALPVLEWERPPAEPVLLAPQQERLSAELVWE